MTFHPVSRKTVLRLFFVSALAWIPLVIAEFPPITNTQDPKDAPIPAEEALQKITLPDGFHVTLFAAEPHVQQPIGIALDERGRLWVAENYTYDGGNRDFDRNRGDRIVMIEDTNHDGRFDQRTVFWDQAKTLTSIEIGFGGVWALCPPHLLFIPDKDGDGAPDGEPEVVLDGWNAGARHTVVNGLRWGPDGWLYGRHGIQALSSVGRPGAPAHERGKINGGIWRYHPTRKVFEVVAQGTTNPWGMDYDDHGQMFFINTVIGHLWHLIPGANYRRMHGQNLTPRTYALIDQHADHYHWDTGKSWEDSREGLGEHGRLGGGHAHSGAMIYLGDNWPDHYRNTLFTINFHGRRFNNDFLERSGSGYVGRHGPDFFHIDDIWFRGLDLIYGPDGGVFVSDWSDFGECHDNDGVHRTSGRIYKITYGPPQAPRIADVGRLSSLELVNLQLDRNDWYVRQARRILQERAAAGERMDQVQSKLLEMFNSQTDVTRQLRAMWALSVTGGAHEDWLVEQLGHPNEHVRTWAIRFLVDEQPPGPEVLERFVRLANEDESGLVRLFLASALQRMPPEQRLPLAAALLSRGEDASDHNLPLMLWYGIEPVATTLPMEAVKLAEASRIPLVRQFIARRLSEELEKQPAPVNALLERAMGRSSEAFAQDLLEGMSQAVAGWRNATPPDAWPALQSELAKSANPELRRKVWSLALLFGDQSAFDELRAVALDKSAGAPMRRAALRTLIDQRPPGLVSLLEELVADKETAVTAVQGLMAFDDPAIPSRVIERYHLFPFEERPKVISALASRPAFAEALLEAIGSGKIERQALSAYDARQIRSAGLDKLNKQLSLVWGDIRATEQDKAELIERYKAQLTPERLELADLSRGRELYVQACASCHKLFGEGGELGPDLTGSGRDNLDYLLENLIDPSAIMAADFRMSIVTLQDGRVLSGILGPETERTMTIKSPAEELTLAREEILQIESSPLSIMPEGIIEGLEEQQVADLIAYLMSPRQVPLIESGVGPEQPAGVKGFK
jgi:putative membrane-bound dehydrogenase-like protein